MSMRTIINKINLTDSSRNQNPINNDLIEYTYSDGLVIKKHYIETTEESINNSNLIQAKNWRDLELARTDFIVPLTDFPNHAAWLTYRQELRDWTTTSDFPDTKPTAPAELK